MRCSEIMKSNVSCLMPTDSVRDAAKVMRDLKVGFLPVCDAEKTVLGTITDRDLAIRILAEGKDPMTEVSDCMSHEVISCSPEDDVKRAQELMAKNRKSRIMCLDKNKHLVGVISLSDIAMLSDSAEASKTLRSVAEREVRL